MSILLNPDLERRISDKVGSGRYHSSSQVVENGLNLLDLAECQTIVGQSSSIPSAKSLWEEIAAIGESIPEDAWSLVPRDLSKQVDHYLHGSPKRSE